MNIRLWVGGSIILLMAIAAVFGSRLAPYEKDYKPGIQYIKTESGSDLVVPPLPPSLEHPFGTDKSGSDLLSSMLYGAKYTFFTALAIATGRMIIGGIIGMFAGIAGLRSRNTKAPFLRALNVLPVFVIVYFFIIHLNTEIVGYVNPMISPPILAVLLGVVLTVLGLNGVITVVQERTAELMKKEFILAAKILGAGKRRLIFKHILPSLREHFAVMFLNETILTLSIMGQLGLFYVFVGGTRLFLGDIVSVTIPYIHTPGNPMPITYEWTGMVGAGRNYMQVQEWIFLFPMMGYVLFILGLYFLQTGLQQVQRTRAPHI